MAKQQTQNVVFKSEDAKKAIQYHTDSVMEECQDWFLRYVKVPKKLDFQDCITHCSARGYEDMANMHCPVQCRSLCCTREHGNWPFTSGDLQ